MGVKLVSASAGSVEIVAPTTASNYTATMPAGTGSVVVNGVNGSLVSGSAVASTSGTSIDFTSIPSWVKRITIMFVGVSMSSTNNVQIQLGTGGTPTYTSSGYGSNFSILLSASVSTSNATSGFVFMQLPTAADVYSGQVIISNQNGNTWVESGNVGITSATRLVVSSGSIALGAALTAVRITSTSTDTFDAGSINILYE